MQGKTHDCRRGPGNDSSHDHAERHQLEAVHQDERDQEQEDRQERDEDVDDQHVRLPQDLERNHGFTPDTSIVKRRRAANGQREVER